MDGAWPHRVGDAWDEGDLRKPWGGRREPDEVLPHPVTHAAAEEDLRPPAATLSSSSSTEQQHQQHCAAEHGAADIASSHD